MRWSLLFYLKSRQFARDKVNTFFAYFFRAVSTNLKQLDINKSSPKSLRNFVYERICGAHDPGMASFISPLSCLDPDGPDEGPRQPRPDVSPGPGDPGPRAAAPIRQCECHEQRDHGWIIPLPFDHS